MHWIAASEQRLRDASDQFRANSGPIFSPIFLRCAPRRIRLAGPDYPNGTPTMLPRQPLRFLIIMAGLLTKEMVARGDLKRCLIVCPGCLTEQWQDDLSRKFHLPFEILTNDKFEAARTGHPPFRSPHPELA